MQVSATETRPPPSLVALFLAFGKIGLFSFGGGSTTLVLMEQEIVRHRGWMTTREFLFSMALSRMWPGVHLIAQSVLIGHLLRGMAGSLTCLLGMMLPATAVTIAFTASFVVLRENPLGAGMISGILPATAGLALAVGYRFARGEVAGEPRGVAAIVLGLAVASFVALAFLRWSSVLIVLGAGVVAIFLFRRVRRADGSA